MAQKEPTAFQIQPRVYNDLCNFLASLYVVTELPKVNTMFKDLQHGTRAVFPPEPEKPAKGNGKAKPGKGEKTKTLEPAGKEH
jgi:hypothetical protein